MSPDRNTVLIIGIGNEFRRDDAVGLIVARRLAGNDMTGVELMEVSGDCTGLLDAWRSVGKVIVVDAVSSGAQPGTIHRIESDGANRLESLTTLSTHGFGLREAIRFARLFNQLPAELVIYGIEGQNFGPGLGLSLMVEAAVSQVAEYIKDEVGCTSMA